MEIELIINLKVTPGLHEKFNTDKFKPEERGILNRLSRDWLLTSSGDEIKTGQTSHKYFLMKPTAEFSEAFNIDREVVCIFSSYASFDARSIDVFESVYKLLPRNRVETICGILISKDNDIEVKVSDLMGSDPEQPIIVPFTYNELYHEYVKENVDGRFRKNFHSRDLFSFLSPLRKDVYFFGRGELVNDVVNKHRSCEHSSLFGLRKSGKTSITYAIQRKLELSGSDSLLIDCESPSIHKLRWFELLELLVKEFHALKKSKIKINFNGRYDEKHASSSFDTDILKIYNSKKKISTQFIFDEIERVTPGTASTDHWNNEKDFIYFWQTLRAFFQKHQQVLTYMLVGTNPSSVEAATILDHDNPIYSSIPSQYVPNFTLEQVTEMVTKLGGYMGILFDGVICAKLFNDFGGHPFLTRQMCSFLHKALPNIRPVRVDKSTYNRVFSDFKDASHQFLDMMIVVLKDWYPDEYEMLKYLSNEDNNSFEEMAAVHPVYTRHLIGYGLVQKELEGHSFNLEILSSYLKSKHKYTKLHVSQEDRLAEISARRNAIEKNLRQIIRMRLKSGFGDSRATEMVLSALPKDRREKLNGVGLGGLLHKSDSPLFFIDLKNLISKNWEDFKYIFTVEKSKFITILDEINSIGRPDAHAKEVTDEDFAQLRIYFKKMESLLSNYLD